MSGDQQFKPGDLVSINGALGEHGVIPGTIREIVKRAWGWCAVMCTSDSEYLRTIPVHHLHPVSNDEYTAWLHSQYVRRHQPPIQGPVKPPKDQLDPEVERAIQILAIGEALRKRWQSNGILPNPDLTTAGDDNQPSLFGDVAA